MVCIYKNLITGDMPTLLGRVEVHLPIEIYAQILWGGAGLGMTRTVSRRHGRVFFACLWCAEMAIK